MYFQGFLIMLGGSEGEIFPNEFIVYDTYEATPNMRLDLDSKRDTTGHLHRNVLSHTATEIKFTVLSLDNLKHDYLLDLIHRNMSNEHTKTITLYYWDDEYHTYKTGTFYVPDLKFKIRSIDEKKNRIDYNELEVSFIEY